MLRQGLILLLVSLSGNWARISTKEFSSSLLSFHDDGFHGDRFLLCEEMPGSRSLNVYFFNLVNVAKWEKGTALPEFESKAPLVFSETRQRWNCSIGVDDYSIYYDQKRDWKLEKGDPTTPINTANIPLQRLGQAACEYENPGKSCIPSVKLPRERYIRTDTLAKELLTTGVDVSAYNKFIRTYPGKLNAPELEQQKFGIWPELNAPTKFRLDSNPKSYGNLILVDGQKDLPWWQNKNNQECSKLQGTEGEIFSGEINKDTILYYYSEDLCTSIQLQFERAISTYGFEMLRFVFAPNLLESSTCFCPQGRNCLPQGVVDVSVCKNGLPYVMSLPHFLNADPGYLEKVSGLRPEYGKHRSYFHIEPVTGLVVESSQKFQLNINVKKFNHPDLDVTPIPTQTIFPLYWFEKDYKLNDDHIKAIREYLKNPTTTTTSTTAAPGPVTPPTDPLLVEMDRKLNLLTSKLNNTSTGVFLFIAFTILLIASFILFVSHRNEKAIKGVILSSSSKTFVQESRNQDFLPPKTV